MTSNPKTVQNGQRSSPNLLAFWVREVVGRGQCSQIAAQSPSVNSKTIYQRRFRCWALRARGRS
jgi:hypothetical protein